MNIIQYYIGKLTNGDVISRDKLQANLRSAVDDYREFTLVYLKTAIRIIGNSEKGNAKNKDIEKLFKAAGFRVKTAGEALAILETIGDHCVDGNPKLERMIEVYLPQYAAKETLTVKQLGVLDLVDQTVNVLNFINELAIAVVYYVTDGEYDIGKKEAHLLDAAKEYADAMVAFHTNYRKELDAVEDLSDTRVDTPPAIYMREISNKDKNFINARSGFNGNVVFHLNNLWGDVKIWYYEYLNSRRDWMKAKLQELELKLENGDGDEEQIREIISRYEDRIMKYEKRINDFEEEYS